jgi:hypothetical protein
MRLLLIFQCKIRLDVTYTQGSDQSINHVIEVWIGTKMDRCQDWTADIFGKRQGQNSN